MSKVSVTIRHAQPEDTVVFASLFLESAPFFRQIFGKKASTILTKLFQQQQNLFSFQHTYIAESRGQAAGMILTYDFNRKKAENWQTGLQLMQLGWPALIRFWKTFWIMHSTIGHLTKGDYYISNIAVYRAFRGQGIGKAMIEFAQEQAQRLGCSRLVLDVEEKNEGAIAFYFRLGFHLLKAFSIPLHNDQFIHFYRLEKRIGVGGRRGKKLTDCMVLSQKAKI